MIHLHICTPPEHQRMWYTHSIPVYRWFWSAKAISSAPSLQNGIHVFGWGNSKFASLAQEILIVECKYLVACTVMNRCWTESSAQWNKILWWTSLSYSTLNEITARGNWYYVHKQYICTPQICLGWDSAPWIAGDSSKSPEDQGPKNSKDTPI
jgi:hypothetical protein